jgi:ATP-dependent DNA helicase RecG
MATNQNLLWCSSLKELNKNKTSKTIETLNSKGINSINDLLWLLPKNVRPIKNSLSSDLKEGEALLLEGKITNYHSRPVWSNKSKKRFLSINASFLHEGAIIPLRWFYAYPNTLERLKTCYEQKSIIAIRGIVQFTPIFQIINPSLLLKLEEHQTGNPILEYPKIADIKSLNINRLFKKIPEYLWQNLPEFIPSSILNERNLPRLSDAFQSIHGIKPYIESEFQNSILRLKYQELFIEQFHLYLDEKNNQIKNPYPLNIDNQILKNYLSQLPFILRESQKSALKDIFNDFSSSKLKVRLINGDVGSGKSIIAFLTMCSLQHQGVQSAFMAPTENLVHQHYRNFIGFFPQLSTISCAMTSKNSSPELFEKIAKKEFLIIFGTHSLIQEKVHFDHLRFITIDEQHRFGVNQRHLLFNKGFFPHTLLLSATPIPRTLKLTKFKRLDISELNNPDKKDSRNHTKIINRELKDKFLSFLLTRLKLKEQAFIVVPAIEDNTETDLKSVEIILQQYKDWFTSFKICYLHGKLPSEEKINILNEFSIGNIDILVSTTVIEVGIDIPNATIMAIYNPERFGLSTLHQLRGRVGRGQKPGFCFLISDNQLNPIQIKRLEHFSTTYNGLDLAEQDLANRGHGDLIGDQQTGKLNHYKITESNDTDLISQVSDDFDRVKDTDTLENLITEKIPNKSFFTNPV